MPIPRYGVWVVEGIAGRLVPHGVPGPDNNILDKVEPILAAAIKDQAKIYLFGSLFGSGIHDIHMNQGNLPRYPNGVYQDAAILVEFQDDHWEAIPLAFASQKTKTNAELGEALRGVILLPRFLRSPNKIPILRFIILSYYSSFSYILLKESKFHGSHIIITPSADSYLNTPVSLACLFRS